ncbi:MAG TPA: hypothetical protein VFC19_00930 [Candidatus Limnocylindrales bacterium]|nr:hypothetical protein [Candidatus Limnocylindrales bacterium]
MAGHGFLLSAEDAKRAVKAYLENAGNATATLKAMLGRVDELISKQPDGLEGIAEELKTRITQLIVQVDSLSLMVQSTNDKYGSSGTDIAHTFNTVYGRPTA